MVEFRHRLVKMTETYQKILVPLDGSKLAEKALPYARDLAVRFGGEIILINVRLPAEDPSHPALEPYLKKIKENMDSQVHTLAKDEKINIHPVTVSVGDVARHPAEGIVDYATSENVGLIVMASHGHSGIKHWALGGVSDKVLHISNIPVLLIRAGRDGGKMFNKILVPLDGSELAECIFPQVTNIATGYDSSGIVFLRVVEPFFDPAPGERDDGGHVYTRKEVQEIEQRNEGAAEEYLGQVINQIGLEPARMQSEVLGGNVAETIINYAKNSGIDLIIMSTHGHSGISRWTLGSITERVLHYSELPVLLVRARECAL
jgi:nucleotide-binding universal stress UspA family protein